MNATLSKPKPSFPKVGDYIDSGQVIRIETRVTPKDSLFVRQGKSKPGDTYRVFVMRTAHGTLYTPEDLMNGWKPSTKEEFEKYKALARSNALRFYEENPHLV